MREGSDGVERRTGPLLTRGFLPGLASRALAYARASPWKNFLESLPVFARGDERLHYFSVHKVAIELISLFNQKL
jgi:hypothetical protein